MAKYVMYYNIGGMPINKATEQLEKIRTELKTSGIVSENDKLAIIAVRDSDTRIDVLES